VVNLRPSRLDRVYLGLPANLQQPEFVTFCSVLCALHIDLQLNDLIKFAEWGAHTRWTTCTTVSRVIDWNHWNK